ncbi:hypothetical protein DAEQUDRAFT_647371, partial [Daedalea quercina L-15889]
ARHDAMEIPSCSEGTRTQLIEDVCAWAESKSSPPVFFLSGVAGSGKSTVAKTVCSRLESKGLLGSSFFCSRRMTPEQRNVRSIIPTLVYHLSLRAPSFAAEVRKALETNPGSETAVLEQQFRVLIGAPAKAAFTGDTALVMVIDALDECDDIEATFNFLSIVLREIPRLNLKVLATSRPEPRIRDKFGEPGSQLLRLQDIDSDIVEADIREYLTKELSRFQDNWPSPRDIEALVSRSQRLFIYAATACRYV